MNYRYIYIIRNFDNKLNIEQVIEFEDYRNFASLSHDGEYLATWDYKSGEF